MANIVSMLRVAGRGRIDAVLGQRVYRLEGGRLAGLLPESQMGLRPFDGESQFSILVASRQD